VWFSGRANTKWLGFQQANRDGNPSLPDWRSEKQIPAPWA